MSDAERYRQRATELERIARESLPPDLRCELLKLADDWRGLAEQVTRVEQRSFEPREGKGDDKGMRTA